jgi:hypothetical protein
MAFDFDAGLGRVVAAGFESRLFQQTALCYGGSFPTARIVTVAPGPGGVSEVSNGGARAWPAGLLLAGGAVHRLPALEPGARTVIGADAVAPAGDALARTALTRVPPAGVAALWPLDLGGVAAAPVQAQGWLLLAVPP